VTDLANLILTSTDRRYARYIKKRRHLFAVFTITNFYKLHKNWTFIPKQGGCKKGVNGKSFSPENGLTFRRF
jgi:hypothetical protein